MYFISLLASPIPFSGFERLPIEKSTRRQASYEERRKLTYVQIHFRLHSPTGGPSGLCIDVSAKGIAVVTRREWCRCTQERVFPSGMSSKCHQPGKRAGFPPLCIVVWGQGALIHRPLLFLIFVLWWSHYLVLEKQERVNDRYPRSHLRAISPGC